jgi:transcriptional regulator with XRE-family HTH domain
MPSLLQVVAAPPAAEPESSLLAAARVRRRLTVEEAAVRTGLPPEEIRSLEEGRIYRFPSVNDALAATLVYANALGITEREVRGLVGRDGGLGRSRSRRRLAALAAFLLAVGALAAFLAVPELRDAVTPAPPAPSAEAEQPLPPPWEIRVDVFNGTELANAATLMANEIAGPLAYRLGTVENAERLDYVQTRVYYPPGSHEIAERLADDLGVQTTALPTGDDASRLVVIVGLDRAGGS